MGENHWAQVLGVLLGAICYLVDPGAAFAALWIAVLCDLFSRLIAEAKKHGGFYRAVKDGHIHSDKMFRGTAVKITAYFFMCVLANQSKYILMYDAPAQLFSTIIYAILFWVEVWSMSENFEEAGVPAFGWIRRLSKRKLEELVDGDQQVQQCQGDDNNVSI